MPFNPKFTITPRINKALVEIERVRGFLFSSFIFIRLLTVMEEQDGFYPLLFSIRPAMISSGYSPSQSITTKTGQVIIAPFNQSETMLWT